MAKFGKRQVWRFGKKKLGRRRRMAKFRKKKLGRRRRFGKKKLGRRKLGRRRQVKQGKYVTRPRRPYIF